MGGLPPERKVETNMKKLLALALALSLALFSAAALAAEINWSDVEANAAEIDAAFVSIDQVGLKIWVPSVFQSVELTAEDTENGYIAYFQPADETAGVGVTYTDVSGMSLEDYAAALPGVGATSIDNVQINGLPGVSYDLEETSTSVVAFATDAGYILEFAFAPMSDEGFAAIAYMMVSSIQAM